MRTCQILLKNHNSENRFHKHMYKKQAAREPPVNV